MQVSTTLNNVLNEWRLSLKNWKLKYMAYN